MKIVKIPDYVQDVLEIFEQSGFEAYVVGGCVRDSIMQRVPDDWDVCTSAMPDEVIDLFKGKMPTIPTGIKHGTVTVLSDKKPVEVTTYRVDGEYSDSRRPDSVKFVRSLIDDLARRDFTMNAIAYNPQSGIVDPFGGETDIKSKLIRCVGEPRKRFSEDVLRILRALRFSAVCGFEIEENTSKAILGLSENICEIAVERIYKEFKKLILADKSSCVITKYREVFEKILPECFGETFFDESMCGKADLLPKRVDLRLAVLALMADEPKVVSRRLKVESKTAKTIDIIVESIGLLPPESEKETVRFMSEHGDFYAESVTLFNRVFENTEAWDKVYKNIKRAEEENACRSLRQLDINGFDLCELGIYGPQIGDTMKALLGAVIDKKCENTKEELIKLANSIKI